MESDKKVTMIVAASSAVAYKKNKPNADAEEIMKHVMKGMDAKKDAKVFGFAAYNFVIKEL